MVPSRIVLITAMAIVTVIPKADSAPPSSDLTQAQTACVLAAFQDYNNANIALGVKESVESIIAQRRLEEQYCLRYAACVTSDVPKNSLSGLAYAAEFSSCLSDEAKAHNE